VSENTHVIVAIRDAAMNKLAPPMAFPSSGFAVRAFSNEVNRKDGNDNLHTHPQDFELWQLAEWNENTGVFEQEHARCIARAMDVKEQK